jgi:hypothetical protein
VSTPEICGMGAGGFTFVFVRFIVKLSTNWNNTTLTHVAGAPRPQRFPALMFRSGRVLVSARLGLSSSPNLSRRKIGKAGIFSPAWPAHPASVHNVHALQGHPFPAPALRIWRPFPRRFDSWIASGPFPFDTSATQAYRDQRELMRAGVSQLSLRKKNSGANGPPSGRHRTAVPT